MLARADSDTRSMATRWEQCLKALSVGRLSRSDATYLLQQVRSTEPNKRPRIAYVNPALGSCGGAVVDQMIEFFSCCPLRELVIEFGQTADEAELGFVEKLCDIRTLEELRLRSVWEGLALCQDRVGLLEGVDLLGAVLLRLQLTSRPKLLHLKIVGFLPAERPSNTQILVDLINGHPRLEELDLESCFQIDNRTSSLVVDAIVVHRSLRWVELPFHIIKGGAAGPLIRHFAEGDSKLTRLELRWLSLKKVDDGGSKTKFSVYRHEHVEWNEKTANIGKLFCEVFCSEVSSISDLEILVRLDPADAEQLWQGLNEYSYLTRLTLHVKRLPSSTLRPLSALQEVRLNPGGSDLEMISFAADLLSQQWQLQNLSLFLGVGDLLGVEDCQDDGAEGEHFAKFQKALQRHPSLRTLQVRHDGSPDERSKFLVCMLGALECNKVIKTLGLDMFLQSGLVMDCLSVCLPRLKNVEKLLLRNNWYGNRAGREKATLLHQVLEQNMSICSIASTHRPEPPPYVWFHDGISKVLRRNTLLHHVQSVMDNLPTMSAGLWVNLVAKLGSNDAEPTPVYALCKSLAAMSLLG